MLGFPSPQGAPSNFSGFLGGNDRAGLAEIEPLEQINWTEELCLSDIRFECHYHYYYPFLDGFMEY